MRRAAGPVRGSSRLEHGGGRRSRFPMLQIVDPQLLAWRTQTLYACPHIFCASRSPRDHRDHCSRSLPDCPPLLTALAAPQLRSSARIPALTPARLPLVLVGSRRLSLSLTGALMHVRLALSRLSPALSPSRPRRISPSLSLPLAPSCVSGLPCRPSAAVLSAHAGQCGRHSVGGAECRRRASVVWGKPCGSRERRGRRRRRDSTSGDGFVTTTRTTSHCHCVRCVCRWDAGRGGGRLVPEQRQRHTGNRRTANRTETGGRGRDT